MCYQAKILIEADLILGSVLIAMLLNHGNTQGFNQLNVHTGCERLVFDPWACRRTEQRVDGCCEREVGWERKEVQIQLIKET